MRKKTPSTRTRRYGQRIQRGAGYTLISATGKIFKARVVMRDGKMILFRL